MHLCMDHYENPKAADCTGPWYGPGLMKVCVLIVDLLLMSKSCINVCQSDLLLCPCLGGPVDGGWGQWGQWTSCDGGGMKQRHRSCDSPRPANGGRYCPGGPRYQQTYCDNGRNGPGGRKIILL